MAECYRCPYTKKIRRRFGSTTHCNLEPTNFDVTYYCYDEHKDEENSLCPFVCKGTRYPGVDYRNLSANKLSATDIEGKYANIEYETKFLTVK